MTGYWPVIKPGFDNEERFYYVWSILHKIGIFFLFHLKNQ